MKSNRYLATTAVIAAGFLATAPAYPQAQQSSGEFEETVICTNEHGDSEPIYISGTFRILMQFVEAGDHVTSIFQVFWEGDAWGLSSGSEYLLRGKWMEVIQENPPYIFLWNDHFQLVGKGRAENYDTYFRVRIVNDANGTPIMEYIDFVQCTNP